MLRQPYTLASYTFYFFRVSYDTNSWVEKSQKWYIKFHVSAYLRFLT